MSKAFSIGYFGHGDRCPDFQSDIIINHFHSGGYFYMDKDTIDMLKNPYVEITMSIVSLMYDLPIRDLINTSKQQHGLLQSVTMYYLFDICEESFDTIASIFTQYTSAEVETAIESLISKMDSDRHLQSRVRLTHHVIKEKVLLKEFQVGTYC